MTREQLFKELNVRPYLANANFINIDGRPLIHTQVFSSDKFPDGTVIKIPLSPVNPAPKIGCTVTKNGEHHTICSVQGPSTTYYVEEKDLSYDFCLDFFSHQPRA